MTSKERSETEAGTRQTEDRGTTRGGCWEAATAAWCAVQGRGPSARKPKDTSRQTATENLPPENLPPETGTKRNTKGSFARRRRIIPERRTEMQEGLTGSGREK